MIFERRSASMLKYEKAKSKLIEFDIDKEDYPKFPFDSVDLTYTTILILSRYCEEYIENPNSDQLNQLKSDLISVSQYFDTTVKTKLRQEYNALFLLLGATAYFLSENFGSAKVLIEQISLEVIKDDIMGLLYVTLYFLLTGKRQKISLENQISRQYLGSLKGHFEKGSSSKHLFNTVRRMRKEVYQSTRILDINFIDILVSVVICAINHSAWNLLPKYSRSDIEQWRYYLSKTNSIRLVWPAQKVILQAGTLAGEDVVIPLPTGVGKTKSIEIILRSKFMREGTCIAVIIAPLRALCNEITTDITVAMADEAIINQFTDTTQEDFDLEVLSDTKYVFICTPEKFSYIVRHEPDFLTSVQLYIFDEAHLFDDASRGVQYELLVSEISRNRDKSAQMVLFSAVLSNAKEISGWLFGNEKATVNSTLVKSTEKSIGFLSSDQTIHYYEKDSMSAESFFVPKSINFTELQLKGKERNVRIFPQKSAQDYAIYYASKLCDQGGSAIFAGQARSIPPILRRIVEINERGYQLPNLLIKGNLEEVLKLENLFAAHYGKDSELTKAVRLGAVPHYSNLPNGLKMAIEHALRKRHIRFVVCTTTLAEGVNIPIKYLFLTTFSLGSTSVQIRKMQNLVGRTARSGVYTEGSAIITDFKYYDNRSNWKNGGKFRWDDCKKMFDYGSTEACVSAILSLVSKLQLDYEYSYQPEFLIKYIIENYKEPSCFSNLCSNLKELYAKTVSDDQRYQRYSAEIEVRVAQLEQVAEDIENYLCYIYNSYQDSKQFYDKVQELTTETFAYCLGTNEQKEGLETIFQLIAQKIVSNIQPEETLYFAHSLYGIEVSKQILEWVDEMTDQLEECSMYEMIALIIDLYQQVFPDKVKVTYDKFITIANLWMEGKSYSDIYKELQGQLQINQIEKFCNNSLGYNLCFFIGNVLDAFGDRAENLVDRIAILQKKIKYGVPSRFQIYVCDNVFDDRVIAQALDIFWGQEFLTEKDFKKYMMAEKGKVLKFLEPYPEYFSYKFQMYCR